MAILSEFIVLAMIITCIDLIRNDDEDKVPESQVVSVQPLKNLSPYLSATTTSMGYFTPDSLRLPRCSSWRRVLLLLLSQRRFI